MGCLGHQLEALGPLHAYLAVFSSQAADGSTARLVLLAGAPWSAQTHSLFPAHARQRAVDVMWAGWLLSRSGSFDGHELALTDIWRGFVLPHAVTRHAEQEGESGRSEAKGGEAIVVVGLVATDGGAR